MSLISYPKGRHVTTQIHTPETVSAAAAVASADPATLLASLVSLTGDTDRMDRFVKAIRFDYTPDGILTALPPELDAELHTWALDVLESGHTERQPMTDETFARLATALTSIPVTTAEAAFYCTQAGLTETPAVNSNPAGAGTSTTKLAIIGAGMTGIALAVAAKEAGIDFVIYEKSHDLGGVWLRNRYPGVGVDTPSVYYSFSFEVNRSWSHNFPEGGEYLDYLHRVANKYAISDHIVFGAEVKDLNWDETTNQWHIGFEKDSERQRAEADVVVTAQGYLTNTQLPNVPGVEDFAGQWFHSADWPDDAELTGKRVAVVGTGCTSVQVVDSIADQVSSLVLFQRQPHWVGPTGDGTVPEGVRWLSSTLATYAEWNRLRTYIPIADSNYDAVRYDEAWAAEHELSISAVNDMHLQRSLKHLEESFADRPDLLEILKPDYAPFGKRPVRDPGAYYSTLKRDTSTVVTSGLAEVVPAGIIDGAGTLHEVDIIIYATGFKLEFLRNWDISGRDGLDLNAVWSASPKAYNSCLVPGFPNLFITSGPHANASHGGGHNFTVEAMTTYVIESIKLLEREGKSTFEVTTDALDRWNTEIAALLEDSVWARQRHATTYYRNDAGDIVLPNPLTMVDFWTRLRAPDVNDIEFR